ncbi:MAG TPA: (5-formylfuran-3-yl)methyl phosphate synthase, partial [Candidatus Acidoferrales bacterium]|nr:(5-formylfuran-3-yl)methyl phosphate synthase [Candidatus Acidoferrales bacterium]
QQVNKAAKTINPQIKVVAAGYADAQKIGTLNPALIPEIAHQAGADVAMLDTATKNGTTLFTYQNKEQLQTFIQTAHNLGLKAALAGSLHKQDLATIYQLGADIAGLRSAACTNNDRNSGHITRERVNELVLALQQAVKA